MYQPLINHPKMRVSKATGIEGPHYDPYSYEEVTLITPSHEIVIHIGLAVWVDVNKLRIDALGENYDNPHKWADGIIQQYTGYTLTQLQRFHDKAASKCRMGGYHEAYSVRGYPGESFDVCTKCAKTVNYYFCESAII